MWVLLAKPFAALPPPCLLEQVLREHAEQHQQAVVRLPPAIGWVAGIPQAQLATPASGKAMRRRVTSGRAIGVDPRPPGGAAAELDDHAAGLIARDIEYQFVDIDRADKPLAASIAQLRVCPACGSF